MNFDNMEPDYKKDEESDLQKMARQTNKNVFLAVTAGVFISLGFAAIIFIVFLNMGFITLNKFNADGTRRDTDGTTKLTEIQDKMQNFYYSDNVDPEALKDAMYKGYVSAYVIHTQHITQLMNIHSLCHHIKVLLVVSV